MNTGRLQRLSLQHRMMLWLVGIILMAFASVLAVLHLRITGEVSSEAYSQLARTRTLFENIYSMRGEDLLSKCNILAQSVPLRNAVARRSSTDLQAVLEAYAPMLGVVAVRVVSRDGKLQARWWHRGGKRHASASFLDNSVLRALNETEHIGLGMEVCAEGLYQTAWADVCSPYSSRQMAVLVIGTPIDNRLAARLGNMSGTTITFFAGLPDGREGAVHPRIVASTLPEDAQQRLRTAMLEAGINPLHVRAQGLASPYLLSMEDGTRYLSLTVPIRGENRKVIAAYVVQRPLHEEMILVYRMQRTLVATGLVAFLVALCASFVLASGITRRIRRVARAAEGLSTGDWSRRVPVEGPEDIRILAEAFNQMASRLQGWDADLRAEVALRTEELHETLARLDANLRQMRQFHADASHELRTPLTIMRGEVEVALRTSRSPEEYQRALHSILEEMSRVSTIVDHLLLLARADSGQTQVAHDLVEINDTLEDLYAQAVLLSAPKGIKLTLDQQDRVVVLGDEVRLRQLFLNLVDNAIKYTPEGGSVRLRIAATDSLAVVSIADTGIGIVQEDLPHIFDRFFRADRARSRERGGTGLGLAICQWIVDAHQGWIDVQSAPGEGSTFTVYLPRALPETAADTPGEDGGTEAARGGGTARRRHRAG